MPAGAAVADHLQCFKIKDALAKTSYTVTLTPTDTNFPTAAGCTIKVPAKMLCVDVTKTNVVGTRAPGPVVGAPTDKFLCYKAKCPKASPTATVTDQFGTHQVTVKGTGLLCAPAPTVTTTTTASTTTTTGGCAQDLDCTPSGNQCQPAVCVAGVCGTQNLPIGTPCNQNGGTVCDANNTCVQCLSSGDCPPPTNQCVQATCSAETCANTPKPQGSPCNQNGGTICDSNSTCVQCISAGNCPPTGNQCILPTCSAGTCGTMFAPAGTACNQGGTNCNGAGSCV